MKGSPQVHDLVACACVRGSNAHGAHGAGTRSFAHLIGALTARRDSRTVQVINSAVVKLSKLTFAAKVYRGVSGGRLPKHFRIANEYGVRGGIDPAFMSTTTDRQVALTYASSSGGPGVVFSIQQGMVRAHAHAHWHTCIWYVYMHMFMYMHMHMFYMCMYMLASVNVCHTRACLVSGALEQEVHPRRHRTCTSCACPMHAAHARTCACARPHVYTGGSRR